MSDSIPQIIENCPDCGLAIDVTDQAPFTEVQCPACSRFMRARVHFNNFTLLELLGEGGMGSVFRARDNNLNREVALKILKREAGATEADWAKLAEEARLTASINHPNVVKVFSFGEDNGQFYLAMELVEKSSLDRLMMLQTRVAEAQVLDVGIQTAEGLQAALEHGLIHRDIKPGNILFASANLAKIVDFGLARVLDEGSLESGEIWGTPFYVAPEKLDGRPEDFRSDIYSLGGTLFHALSGRPPFDAKTASMVVLKHIKSQAVSLQAFAPHISDETAYVINRMLNKEPEHRYQSYEELLNHLQYARHRLMERMAVQEPKKHARKAQTRSAALGVIWTSAVVACCAVIWFFFLSGLGESESPADAADPAAAAKLEQGREALLARKFPDAAAMFSNLSGTASGGQKCWALAQLAVADYLAGKPDDAAAALTKLRTAGPSSCRLREQPLVRFFEELSRAGGSGNFDPSDFEAFGLLTAGLERWNAGELDVANERFKEFSLSKPVGVDAWVAKLKPLAEPYLKDFGTYAELRSKVDKVRGEEAADLLVRIDEARRSAQTGTVIAGKLDELKEQVRIE